MPAYAQLPAVGVTTMLGIKVERAESVLYIKRYAGPVPHDSVTDIKVQCPLSKDRASATERGLRALEQQALENREIRSASQLGAFHPSAATGVASPMGSMARTSQRAVAPSTRSSSATASPRTASAPTRRASASTRTSMRRSVDRDDTRRRGRRSMRTSSVPSPTSKCTNAPSPSRPRQRPTIH